MQSLQQLINGIITPSSTITDPVERSHITWLAKIMLILLPLGLIVAIIPPLFKTSTGILDDPDFVIFASSMFLWIIPLLMLRSGYYQLAALSLMTVATCVILAASYTDNTLHDLHYLLMPIIFGSVLLPARKLWLFSVASLSIILFFPLIQSSMTFAEVIADPIGYVTLGFLLLIFVTQHRDTLEKFRREELAQTHQELREQILERERAERKALELDIEKERVKLMSTFITDVSHDFKTPLATINTSLYLMKKNGNTEKQGRYVEMIEIQTTRLQELVEGLLEMTRLDSNITLNMSITDVNHLVNEVYESTAFRTSRNEIKFILNLDYALPPLMVDSDELSTAFSKIIDNAVLYTPTDGRIYIRTFKENNRFVLEVQDTGIGIADSDLPHIFSRFFRADRSRSGSTWGTGLGLSIARKIVEAHKGEITVQSIPGQGSTFRVYLPLAVLPVYAH
ncbi:MAG TPA: HAMP domain-containing sensor histidine kinase [Aggregatilineales bacterium]|nr:HAMP domain-containing sensor histidine kinase [Aggregatilineales bacterium]